jgi:hypothetical protein
MKKKELRQKELFSLKTELKLKSTQFKGYEPLKKKKKKLTNNSKYQIFFKFESKKKKFSNFVFNIYIYIYIYIYKKNLKKIKT